MRKLSSWLVLALVAGATPALAGWDEGVSAFKAKNYQLAAQEFQTLVESNPEGFQGHYMLGLSLDQLNRDEEALRHLRKAYDLNPKDVNVQLALARAYQDVRRYGDAAQLLASANPAQLAPAQQLPFYQIRGEARFRSGNEAGALGDFEQLAKLSPTSADAQYVLGTTALSLDRVDVAVTALAKASQLAPNDSEKKQTYINALLKQGRMANDKAAKKGAYSKAAAAAKQLVTASPTYDNLMLQTSAELGAGQYAQAAATGQAAIAKKSNDWLAYYYVGQAHTSAGNFSQAEAPLRQALGQTTDPAAQRRIWSQLGFAFEKAKAFDKAIEAYQKAGDQTALARVKTNEQTHTYNEQVEAENERLREVEAEAQRLEKELKELEGGNGGGF